jgi:hypothetical protein
MQHIHVVFVNEDQHFVIPLHIITIIQRAWRLSLIAEVRWFPQCYEEQKQQQEHEHAPTGCQLQAS